MLDLFENRLTLEDIQTQDISLLNDLVAAQGRLYDRKFKERQKMEKLKQLNS
jgi:hypothetical protein